MNTLIGRNITVHEPNEALIRYAEENLVLDNPAYIKKQRMGFWVGREPKHLRLYEWNGDALVFPFGLLMELMPEIRKGVYGLDFRQDEEIDYGEPMPLYDYQQKAVDAMKAAKYGILQSPAGSGKTQMAIALIMRWKKRALWLCHTADLLKQSRDRAERYMDAGLIGTITEGKVHIGRGVTFATVQTMANLDLPLYRDEWDVVFVDECHRLAGSPTQLTRYYKVLNNLAARHKYGLTATPERSDGLIKATYALIGEVAYTVPDAAVKDRVMQVRVQKIETDTEAGDECLNEDGTINFVALIGYLAENADRNRLIAQTIAENAGHSCLILSDRIAQLEQIRNMLPESMRDDAALINGKMTTKKGKEEREIAIEKMRTGEKKYLFATYSLAKEGLDVPRLDRLFLASPVKFSAVVIQSIGRIARVCENKETPVAYDFVDGGIGYCERAWKERKRHYRKAGAEIREGMA